VKRVLVDKTLGKIILPKTVTFHDAITEFLDESQRRNRPLTTRDYKRLITSHFHFGNQPLCDIAPQNVLARLRKLRDTPSEQKHALVAFKVFMSWCARRLYVQINPCDRLQAPATSIPRDRVLTDSEVADVFRRARKASFPFGSIIQLLILTGQRRGEIAGLRWEWINQGEKAITLPASITKNKRAHKFPYGDMTSSVLAEIPRQNEYGFPAQRDRNKEKPATIFAGWGKPKAAFDKACPIAPWTLHDLRRTFATNLAALGVRMEVTEKLLNHVSGSFGGIVGVYQRHQFQDEMRAAIEAWERRLTHVLEANPAS
jgi:integrase